MVDNSVAAADTGGVGDGGDGAVDSSTTGSRSGGGCPYVPQQLKQELRTLKISSNTTTSSGKEYWGQTATSLGIYEDDHGLRFHTKIGDFICPRQHHVKWKTFVET